MEMHQLRYFVAVAREGNFTRAARACHVSQPSLSQQIRKLEDELGQSLLHRLKSGKSVLTPAGELFFPRAVRILQEANTAAAEMENIGDTVSGSVRMGAIPTLAPYLVPDAVTRFNRDYPEVELIAHETTTAELLAMLWRNELDFALASPPFSGGPWEMQSLGAESLLLAAAATTVLEAEHAPAEAELAPVVAGRAHGETGTQKGKSAVTLAKKTAAKSAKTSKGQGVAAGGDRHGALPTGTPPRKGQENGKNGKTAAKASLETAGSGRAEQGKALAPTGVIAAGGITLNDLVNEEFILMREGHCLSNQVLGFCQQADFRPRVRFLSAQVETLKALIRTGAGVSLLPSLAIDPADTTLRYIRLEGESAPQREIVALWRPEFPLSRAASEFIRYVRKGLEKRLNER